MGKKKEMRDDEGRRRIRMQADVRYDKDGGGRDT